jgi:hypothetical protein
MPYQAALRKEFPQLANSWFAVSVAPEHRHELTRFWHRFGGQDEHPLIRKHHEKLGYDDDAMLVDRYLYDQFLADHAGLDVNLRDKTALGGFIDLDGDEADETFIRRKWLVVVTCHNYPARGL